VKRAIKLMQMKRSFEGVPYSRRGIGGKYAMRRKYSKEQIYSWDRNKLKVDKNPYHAKNGHMNEVYLQRLAERDGVELTGNLHFCDDCDKGKAKRRAVKKISSYVRAGKLFGRVYIDTTGPMKVRAKDGYRYAVVIVDDYSRKKFTYLVKKKNSDEILSALKLFLNEHVLKSGRKLGIIRSDNGGEYKNRDVIEFLADEGVMREYISDYVKQQNAVVETAIRDIKNLTVTLLNGANLRAKYESLWGEAMLYATDTLNWMPTAGNRDFKAPVELSKEKCRPLSARYQWGSMATVIDEGKGQLEDRVHECIFVGYEQNQPDNCCRFLKLSSNKVITSSNYKVYDACMLFNPEKHYFDDTIFLEDKVESDGEGEESDIEESDGGVMSDSEGESSEGSDEEEDEENDIESWRERKKQYDSKSESESEGENESAGEAAVEKESEKENNSNNNSNERSDE
jgi:transposase InsO family protein